MKTFISLFLALFIGLTSYSQHLGGFQNWMEQSARKSGIINPKDSKIPKKKLDSLIGKSYIPSYNAYVKTFRMKYDYNADSNMTAYWEHMYDSTNQQWVPMAKYEYTYNSADKKTEDIRHTWSGITYEWKKEYRNRYTYINNVDLKTEIHELWNVSISDWEKKNKRELSYNSAGDLSIEITYNWLQNSNQWMEHQKREFTYDSAYQLVEETHYIWDTQQSQWGNTERKVFSYDSSGNRTEEIKFEWNSSSNQWVNKQKRAMSYDSAGHQVLILMKEWKASQGWVNKEKMENTYDSLGNRSSEIQSDWDDSQGKWIYDEKSEAVYNNNYTQSDLILPEYFFEEAFTHMVTGFKNFFWEHAQSSWKQDSEMSFYYSDFVVNTDFTQKPLKAKVYPNPANGHVNIDLPGEIFGADFTLYDMQGRTLLHKQIQNRESLNLENLKAGLYLYTLKTERKQQNGKLILK